MRFFTRRYLVIVLLFLPLGALVGAWAFFPRGIVSPVAIDAIPTPNALLSQVKGASTLDSYPPSSYFPTTSTPRFTDTLGISAHSYAVMDRDTKELLLAHNLTQERPIASVAKIMTAIVALEQYHTDTQLLVGIEASHTGEAFMGLSEGEVVTVEDLLYGLLLPSGNDAAEVLAAGLRPGDGTNAPDLVVRQRNHFIMQMNQTAEKIGMKDTYFFNPTGLDESTRSTSTFSTALDLLALSDYALSNPVFARIVATDHHTIYYQEGRHKAFDLYNILQFDRSYPGIRGIKPGVTGFAGETLASYIEKNNRRIILILLDSERTRDDAIAIYDFLLGK